jgi:hypothetical protein
VPRDRSSHRIDRSQLPDEFTPETVRAMDLHTARTLANPHNGILTPEEQASFDRVLRQTMQRTGERLGRPRPFGPAAVDPELRGSYLRTRRRLDAQTERARRAFPELTAGWSDAAETKPEVETAVPEADSDELDDVTVGTLESEIEQTADTLEILEQIAAIQQQQLEHQRSRVLSETRGVFFALAVSVAVIVAGIAPLVEASAHERRLILLWTAIVCIAAGLVYAIVRAVQSRSA